MPLERPTEPGPQSGQEPELVSHDPEPLDAPNDTKVEEDGVYQQQWQQQPPEQEQKFHYGVLRALREHKFIMFPDTLNPNEEAAIGIALAEARAICERLEGWWRKLRRASWVEDSDGLSGVGFSYVSSVSGWEVIFGVRIQLYPFGQV